MKDEKDYFDNLARQYGSHNPNQTQAKLEEKWNKFEGIESIKKPSETKENNKKLDV